RLMTYKKAIKTIFSLIFILNLGFSIPIFTSIQLLQPNSEYISQKIMFDEALFQGGSNRIIINFKVGTDLTQASRTIQEICKDTQELLSFAYISALCCEVSEEELYQIAAVNTVQKIYLDEEVHLDIQSPDPIPFGEIFQLNQCATQIQSRLVPATGKGINISIIDTGIDFSHADLSGKMLARVSFVKTTYGFDLEEVEDENDLNGHGTHCAGIATGTGSASPTGYNLTGIAPATKLLSAKCLDKFGAGYLSGVLAAINWSIFHKASIISMSLGFSFSDPDHPICRAVDNATKQGIVVVVSAGNSGPFFSTGSSPGAARSVITVGANDKANKITDFSSRGPTKTGFVDPDVLAPGENILSTIPQTSLLQSITEINDQFIAGKYGNGYAILSGTSMSCPMAAGAAALLLELFPNINPYMVRIALMEGAESLGYSPNIEGAGRLDLNESYHFLLNAAPDFNISTVLPKQLPIPPFEFSMFPGDTYSDEIVILSGKNIDMKVECTGNISTYIALKNTTNNAVMVSNTLLYIKAAEAQFTDISVIFDIPLTIQPGTYSGVIQISDNTTMQPMQQVELFFQVISSQGRIYFDCFHNSDYFDSVRSNYYNFTKLLFEKGIQITYGVSLLSFPLLSQYDILIIPDIELPFTQKEVTAIAQYWNSGGNILVLGSSYPQNAIESLNDLLQRLDVGINYTKNNIENSYDIGIGKYYGEFLIANLTGHPITQGIPYFTWLNGVALQVNSLKGAVALANYMNSILFAINNQSVSQKIVCIGTERFFYDDFISYSYNQQLVWQSIEWLLNTSSKSNSKDLRIEVAVSDPILELGTDNRTTIGFFVSNSTGGAMNNLIPHLNLSCQVAYANSGSWTTVWVANASNVIGLDQGAYYFNFSSNLEGLYRVNVTIANLTASYEGIGITYFNCTISMPKIVACSLTTTVNDVTGEYDDVISKDIFRNADQVVINLTIRDDNSGADLRNVSCYITALDTYRSDIKYVQVEMQNITPRTAIETNYSLVLSPDFSYPAGYYHIFIETLDASGYSDYSSPVLEFYIDDKYPIIDPAHSKLNGVSFETLKGQYAPTAIQWGSSFSIEVMGNDTESSLETMHAYAVIFNFFLVGIYAYLYEPLWGTEIPFSTDKFSGAPTFPSNGISQILTEHYTLNGLYVLVVFLLDSDGQYEDDSYTYAMVSIKAPFDYSIIIIVTIICIAAVAVYFIYSYLRKKRNVPKL
ncbi:MAG: S8 family serine peptidase, partial [Candidatus Helarchaeota archaeon]|nr:S8 family serine peptidase [Candidatus Helarchaeota archaeon]